VEVQLDLTYCSVHRGFWRALSIFSYSSYAC